LNFDQFKAGGKKKKSESFDDEEWL
jgi:hypothetical protein